MSELQEDEQAIRRLVAEWMDATKRGDTERVLELMTEDVVFLMPGAPPLVGKAAFEGASSIPPGAEAPRIEGVSEIREIRVLGEWAFMWTKLSVRVERPSGGTPQLREGHTLSILRKENGRWRLARDANMLSPLQQPAATSP